MTDADPKNSMMLKTYLNRNSMNWFRGGGQLPKYKMIGHNSAATKPSKPEVIHLGMVPQPVFPALLRSEDYPLQELHAVPLQQASWSEQL